MRVIISLVASAVLLAGAAVGGAAAGPVSSAFSGAHSGGAAHPTATGEGGAVATVDRTASRAALRVLRSGGNAVDAAVAGAAVLGVTEPYSCGIGGGGFMVIRPADGSPITTIDHRESAPQAFHPEIFIDPATNAPIPFEELVTSGLGVGVPGTVLGWEEALRRYGTRSLGGLLRPAIEVARRGFRVDAVFAGQTEENLERFRAFTSTRRLFLDDGAAPEVGSNFRNPALARTYRMIARGGSNAFYQGPLAHEIVETVASPPVTPSTDLHVRPGVMTESDLRDYDAPIRYPTAVSYRGYDVYSMGPPSSGGSTVGEALNILEGFDLSSAPRAAALHDYIEASKLSYADRNAYLGDPEYTDVPLEGLLSDDYAAERRSLIRPRALEAPVLPGDPFPFQDDPSYPLRPSVGVTAEGPSTTHLTVSDAWGTVVSYTFTIEQIGGSGMVVPGYGFLLNNELTDFEPEPPHPNAPEAGKRPRSSMSPTIVLKDGQPVVALGSPGGATIITTVLQTLVNYIDFGMSLPEAVAAPRISNLNAPETLAEPAFLRTSAANALEQRGHEFVTLVSLGEPSNDIGAVAAIGFGSGGRVQAVAEPERRGGGSAFVEHPD
ncbi:gamma-glutamyltransferase [soil metagenome]